MRKELTPVDREERPISFNSIPKACHFSSDGKCRYHHDEKNKFAQRKGATVRVNDYWVCNYHYENGADRVLRNGECMSVAEQKINARIFGGHG